MALDPAILETDWQSLLEAARGGDPDAINDFASGVGAMARRFFLGKGFSAAEAESRAVTCITETWLRLGRFRGGNFPAWARTVFLHLLVDDFRKLRRSVQGESLSHLDVVVAGTASARPSSPVRHAVSAALKRLHPTDQLILQLRYCAEPLEYSDIAAELQMESGAVRTRCSRALKRLATFLSTHPRIQAMLATRHVRSQKFPP